jgi:hypothetical protein
VTPFTIDLADQAAQELEQAETLTTEQLERLILLAGRTFGPRFLDEAYSDDKITRATVTALIGGIWSSAEYPNQDLDRDTWRWLFDVAGFTVDGKAAERPAKPVELWRGSVPERSSDWSWSTDREVAQRFADGGRGRLPGHLYRLVAPPEALLCANTERGEAEYVVDTHGLLIEMAEDG